MSAKPTAASAFPIKVQKSSSSGLGSPSDEAKVVSPTYLFVKADYKYHKVEFDRILYIENIRDYVKFHLEGDQRIMTLMTLKSLEATLPQGKFMKVHRSYIVNLDKVNLVEKHQILFGEQRVPVSESFREKFNDFLSGK